MTLKEWFRKHKSLELRMELAAKADSSIGYLSQLVYTPKKTSVAMCEKLHNASMDLTPEDVIFPEDERPDIARVFNLKENYEVKAA